LYYGYRTVFLKQNREKLFVATTKHLRSTFGQFFAGFQRIFQLNLRANCAQFARNFSAFSVQFSYEFCTNFAFFPRDFLPGLYVLNSTYVVKHKQNDNSNWICSIVDDMSVNWFYMSH